MDCELVPGHCKDKDFTGFGFGWLGLEADRFGDRWQAGGCIWQPPYSESVTWLSEIMVFWGLWIGFVEGGLVSGHCKVKDCIGFDIGWLTVETGDRFWRSLARWLLQMAASI